jgi:hypothetical protein
MVLIKRMILLTSTTPAATASVKVTRNQNFKTGSAIKLK